MQCMCTCSHVCASCCRLLVDVLKRMDQIRPSESSDQTSWVRRSTPVPSVASFSDAGPGAGGSGGELGAVPGVGADEDLWDGMTGVQAMPVAPQPLKGKGKGKGKPIMQLPLDEHGQPIDKVKLLTGLAKDFMDRPGRTGQ